MTTRIKIRVGEWLKPPMAVVVAAHDFVLPGAKATESKTFGSHAHCFDNDGECEGAGNISQHVYIKLYCNRVTICDRRV